MATALVLGRTEHTVYATMRNPRGAPELAQTAEKEGLPIHSPESLKSRNCPHFEEALYVRTPHPAS